MTLFVLGNVAIDSFYYLKKFPISGETVIAEKNLKDIGGKGFNQVVTASRLGLGVSFWTYIGSDEISKNIFKILEKEKIGSGNILKHNKYTDESIIFINDKGNNYIVSNCLNALSIDKKFVEKMLNSMKKGDSLLLQGNLNEVVTNFCVIEAFKKKIKIFLNASPICFDYKKILPLIDTLIINETENKILSNADRAEIGNKILLDIGISNVVTTKGEKGLILSSNQYDYFLEPPKVEAVDTTGAGDVFCGALTALVCLGNSYKDSCLRAMNIASLSVMKFGTYMSIPTKKQICSNSNLK